MDWSEILSILTPIALLIVGYALKKWGDKANRVAGEASQAVDATARLTKVIARSLSDKVVTAKEVDEIMAAAKEAGREWPDVWEAIIDLVEKQKRQFGK